MTRSVSTALVLPLLALFASPLQAQIDTIATAGSFVASYGTAAQASPRIPWTDLGFQATASVTQGNISGTTGGSTQFQMSPAVTNGESLSFGSAISLAYTPGWTGSVSTAATGNLGLNFGYHFGPISGSTSILSDTMTTGVSGLDLSSSLNTNGLAGGSTTTPGLAVNGGIGASVQAGLCPFCVTVASASVSFHVGTQVTQNLAITPTASYGDYVWYNNGAKTTVATNVTGGAGTVSNNFAPPSTSSLGLPVTGGTFFMNILPYAALNMGVANEAVVAIPASITANWNVLGASGSVSDSGNLYALSTGTENFAVTGDWFSPDVYTIEVSAVCTDPAIGCTYTTVAAPDLTTFAGCCGGGGGGIPPGIPEGNLPPGPPTGGGGSSDFTNLGPLVGNAGCPVGAVCDPPCPTTDANGAPLCVSHVIITRTGVPEPESFALAALALLGLGMVRRQRRS